MHRSFLVSGAALAGIAVALGALGAHSLRQSLTPDLINVYETGVRYHFYHSLALLITGMLYERFRSRTMRFAGYAFIGGIILFSGSLYLITSLRGMGAEIPKSIGILTPIGGVFFITGWILMMFGCTLRNNPLKSV